MKFARYASVILAVIALCSCVGVTRGVHQGALVSTGQPAVAVSVPSLPLITSGEAVPNVTTSSSLGGIPVRTDLAVYGTRRPGAPMAVAALSEAPGVWFWDADVTAPFSITKGFAAMGGLGLQACTYISMGGGDPFSTLSGEPKPNETVWLARRFATRMEVDKFKLTLEYREPLPARIPPNISRLEELPFADADYIRDFEKRAEQAFTVSREIPVRQLQKTYPEGVRTRYMNNNFLGTLSSYEPLGK